MDTAQRVSAYKAQTGSSTLTARQGRRIRHKENEAKARTVNEVTAGRFARLRRRFDRKEHKRVKVESFGFAARVRALADSSRSHGRREAREQKKLDYERKVGIR
jgi:hypothetical protein